MWIELHSTARRHRKIRWLAASLKIPKAHALGLCASLWCWAIENSLDGVVCDGPKDLWAGEIAEATQWQDNPEQLLQTMIGLKLLDESEHGLEIHEWMQYAGSLKSAKRKRKQRAGAVPRDSHGTVTAASRDSHGNVTPDRTGPDRTRPREVARARVDRTSIENEPAIPDLNEIQESLEADILEPDAYSSEEVAEEIRRDGGDPEAIDDRGAAQVQELLDQRRVAESIPEHDPASAPRDSQPVPGQHYDLCQVEGYLYDWEIYIRGERDRDCIRQFCPIGGQELLHALRTTDEQADTPNVRFFAKVLRSQRKGSAQPARLNNRRQRRKPVWEDFAPGQAILDDLTPEVQEELMEYERDVFKAALARWEEEHA